MVARALGQQQLPWQALVSRIAGERHPEDQSRYRYRTVILTVPRQTGKTVGIGHLMTTRALTTGRYEAWYTAQTGKTAARRWGDLVTAIGASPLATHASVKRGVGTQSIAWPNESVILPFAPTPDSLHSETPDLVVLDECWAHSEQLGAALEAAIQPAQQTIPHRQLWMVSTRGDASSTWWHSWLRRGRESLTDPNTDICYIDYSLADNLDPYDPALWPMFHPGAGRLTSLDDMRAMAASMTEGNWLRSICNRATTSRESIIPGDEWAALADPMLAWRGQPLHIAYDVAKSSARSTITGAWFDPDAADSAGRWCLRVIRAETGAAWVLPYLSELKDELHPASVTADDGGETRAVTDQALRAGIEVDVLSTRDLATGTGELIRLARMGQLIHDGDEGLAAAMAAAVHRPIADATIPSRRLSLAPIDAWVSAIVALRAGMAEPVPAPQPLIVA